METNFRSLNPIPITQPITQTSQPNSSMSPVEVYQPKTDLGKIMIITVTGDGTSTEFNLYNTYLATYGSVVVNTLSIQNTAGSGSIDNLSGIKLIRPRIDGADDTNTVFIDLTRFAPTTLSNNKKIDVPVKFLLSSVINNNPNYNAGLLVFKTAPATGEKWTLTLNIERIVGQINVI